MSVTTAIWRSFEANLYSRRGEGQKKGAARFCRMYQAKWPFYMKTLPKRESECKKLRKRLMYHTKSMEYIWAKPRDREKYEKSEFRVGESTGFVKNERFAWDIRQT